MDKINQISDIIKISLDFDTALENGKYCDLQKYSDKLNEMNKIIREQNLSLFDKDILDLIDKLNQVNLYAIKHIAKYCKQSQKEGYNTIIFFYNDKCEESIKFFPEWKKLKSTLKGRVNLIAINCNKKEHENICNFFKIHEYPTIKYITPTKIHDYYGNMEQDQIINTFLLI